MDVVQGDFRFDYATGKPVSPVTGKREYLSEEIANEGQKAVILSDGETVHYSPPVVKAAIPDWSEIKSIKHYFHRVGYAAFPAWFYHPSGEQRIFKNKDEAAEAGIIFRRATHEEKGRYGIDWAWDYEPSCEWRSIPFPGTQKFDPNNPGQGKTYVPAAPNPRVAQNELLAELIPTVVAAVTTALKGGGQVGAPAHIDPGEWDEFLAFQAFKKTQAMLEPVAKPEDPERAAWEAKAKEAGIKIDGRWSLDKLRKHVMTALEARVAMADGTQQYPTQDAGDQPEAA